MTDDAPQRRHTVEKIGGTSMADTESVLNNIFIGTRKGRDLYQRIFVVSAYAGITNKLLSDKKTGEPGVHSLFADSNSDWAWGDALSRVGDDMLGINSEIFGDHADRRAADQFVKERIEGVRSCLLDLHRLCSYGHFNLSEHMNTVREMLSALGEAHSAFNTSLLLQQHGVNSCFVDLTNWRDDEQLGLDEKIVDTLSDIDLDTTLPIVTGYGHCKEGAVATYGRGYTEVIFSRVAVLTGACEAIIHKEFHLSSGDPKLIGEDKVRKIGRTNYDVADQLSNMGMEAIHPSAAKGLRQAEIPLRIKNTFDPDDEGTVISGDYVSDESRTEIVTGLRAVYSLEFFEQDMVRVNGYDTAILQALKHHKIRIITKTSNANTIAHYVEGSLKAIKRVTVELRERFESATITVRKVAIVSAIGSDLEVEGLTARAVNSLSDAGVSLLGVHQLIRNVDIIFIVSEEDYEKSIIALHHELVETLQDHAEDGSGRKPTRAA
ncbi:MAG: aspartate kinase [Woeseiaceae bacterium]|nr:aspartate kinase [Woeseiaceae bacterium]